MPAPVPKNRSSRRWLAVLVVALFACSDSPTSGNSGRGSRLNLDDASCDLARNLIGSGGRAPDGIPALTTPRMVEPDHESAAYLREDDRILGMFVDGQARAYPHNILWWHEIINENVAGRSFAVTYCPLTGSGLVFDRSSMGDPDLDLGVSGLLFANNLMMYDRKTNRLIGPQMSVVGRCGDFRDVDPDLMGVMETTWALWKELHPGTVVVSDQTGWIRDYTHYPYGTYDHLAHESVFLPMPVDRSRPPKELVLGVRTREDGGIGYPFGELAELGWGGVVNDDVEGRPIAIFFEAGGDASEGTTVAFDRRVDGTILTFEMTDDGVRDLETGTVWDLAGRGLEGELTGRKLAPVDEAYVAFWFAWRHFQPDSRIFQAPS